MDQIAHILNNHIGGIMDDFVTTQIDRPAQDFFNNNQIYTSSSALDIPKIKSTIYEIQNHVHELLKMLEGQQATSKPRIETDESTSYVNGEQIIEGVFNGEDMVGSDGQEYSVPPNYASKSKIVEGDLMKLTIRRDGKFIYKQIGPVNRKRVIGRLVFDAQIQTWSVRYQEKNYKILTASATFYRGRPGDEVIILLPQDGEANWGTVENIMR